MAKVEIKSITNDPYAAKRRWMGESTEVWVDGELLGKGYYGGEPEDNFRCRDYCWVEELLGELARSLGADVVVTQEDREKAP